MSTVIMIVIALLVFTCLVVIHEFGHFIAAKKMGVTVEEFAIGMGPKIIGKQIGETFYSIRLLPIGGFCRMLGEDADVKVEGSFGSKRVWKRMIIILAGAFMNFILAFVIIFVLKSVGGYMNATVGELIDGYPAQQAGLQVGDKIIKINNQKIRIYEDLSMEMTQNSGEIISVTVKRNNETLVYELNPMKSEEGQWLIGFVPEGFVKGNVFENMQQSFWTTGFYIKYTLVSFKMLFTGQVSTKDMAGPIGITTVIGEVYNTGIQYSLATALMNIAEIAAIISANLGVVNLLPLPALDGGRFVFLLIEAIRRKPVSPEKEGMVHIIGFIALMVLAIFVAYNDVLKLL